MKKLALVNAALMAIILVVPVFADAEATYFMMHGVVTSYGTEPAYGWCGAYGEVGEWANALLGWALGVPPTPLEEPPENFTYTFYAANLTEATQVELNYSGADLYILGYWNVYKVTFVYEGEEVSYTIEMLVEHGEGTLIVTGGWTAFTVAITGIEEVSGTVAHYCVRSGEEIPIGDVNLDRTINIFDLVHVSLAYGCTPGIGNYDFSIDINFDFTIDIYDLTTIAVNIGESY